MMFSLYSLPDQPMQSLSLEELLELASQGGIVARAEFSGCEGCYVEVARWQEHRDSQRGGWRRFAFEKVFGGEDLSLAEQDAVPEEQLACCATAERIAARINAVGQSAHTSLIHSLPTWEGEPAHA